MYRNATHTKIMTSSASPSLQSTAIMSHCKHCLQLSVMYCNTQTYVRCNTFLLQAYVATEALQCVAIHCNTLQHPATHCNTLQHTATHCNTLQHTAIYCDTLRPELATETLQHTANTLQHTATPQRITVHRNTLQHTWALGD